MYPELKPAASYLPRSSGAFCFLNTSCVIRWDIIIVSKPCRLLPQPTIVIVISWSFLFFSGGYRSTSQSPAMPCVRLRLNTFCIGVCILRPSWGSRKDSKVSSAAALGLGYDNPRDGASSADSICRDPVF